MVQITLHFWGTMLSSREFPFFFLIAKISVIVNVYLWGSADNLEHMLSMLHFLYIFKWKKKKVQFHSGKIKKNNLILFSCL